MNMKKEVMCLLYLSSRLVVLLLNEFKLGHNASQTAANINKTWGEGSTCDQTVQHWFQKFYSGDMNLEDQEGRRYLSALDDLNLKTLFEQNPCQSVISVNRCQHFNNIGAS